MLFVSYTLTLQVVVLSLTVNSKNWLSVVLGAFNWVHPTRCWGARTAKLDVYREIKQVKLNCIQPQ